MGCVQGFRLGSRARAGTLPLTSFAMEAGTLEWLAGCRSPTHVSHPACPCPTLCPPAPPALAPAGERNGRLLTPSNYPGSNGGGAGGMQQQQGHADLSGMLFNRMPSGLAWGTVVEGMAAGRSPGMTCARECACLPCSAMAGPCPALHNHASRLAGAWQGRRASCTVVCSALSAQRPARGSPGSIRLAGWSRHPPAHPPAHTPARPPAHAVPRALSLGFVALQARPSSRCACSWTPTKTRCAACRCGAGRCCCWGGVGVGPAHYVLLGRGWGQRHATTDTLCGLQVRGGTVLLQ